MPRKKMDEVDHILKDVAGDFFKEESTARDAYYKQARFLLYECGLSKEKVYEVLHDCFWSVAGSFGF